MHSVTLSADGRYVYKRCTAPELRQDSFRYYQEEYSAMRALYSKDPAGYILLCPIYHACGRDRAGNPYLKMDHIEGITLEKKLQSMAHRNPHRYLSNNQILHIFNQISAAQRMLRTVDILQLDLNPENIIVVNDDYDIRLIDLTEARCLTDSSRPYNLIDYHASFDIPPSMQLCQAGALLFTRLFYCGNEQYQADYSRSSFLNRFHNYWSLLHCLDVKDDLHKPEEGSDCLYYWDNWLNQLRFLLS